MLENLTSKIEALLFYKNEPVTRDWLVKVLNASEDEVNNAIALMLAEKRDKPVTLIATDSEISLGTHAAFRDLIGTITKEELEHNLSKASMETLTIILYCGPISRASIEYIRGVNSQYTLRHLLMRGLIKRNDDAPGRSHAYFCSTDLLKYLGLSSIQNLPDYAQLKVCLSEIEKANEKVHTNNNTFDTD